jgi:hypothetical protein
VTDRGMSAGAIAEAGAAKNRPVHLFQADFDSGSERLTDAFLNVSWNGDLFDAGGTMIGFDVIRETAELQISDISVHVSGVDQTQVAAVLADDYLDRRLRIWKTFLNADGTIVQPVLIFDGRMDAPVIAEDPQSEDAACTVTIAATSQFADFERTPGRRSNSNVQQLHYPGDLFFDFCSQIPAQKQSYWGRKNPSGSSTSGISGLGKSTTGGGFTRF